MSENPTKTIYLIPRHNRIEIDKKKKKGCVMELIRLAPLLNFN